MASLRELLARGAARLGAPEGRFEAELLLAEALQRDRAWLMAHAVDAAPADAERRFHELIEARAAGRPVAYLLGHRGFWTLDLEVSPEVLIPRPETELLVEAALQRLAPGQPLRVVDLGTGSGAIALAIAAERPEADVLATDASAGALAVAQANAHRLGLDRVRFLPGDWYAPLAGERFDLVVSNPPYIADDDPHVGIGDLRFEPRAALVSGSDGLDALRIIAAGAPAHLVDGGWLLVEHGHQQGAAVRALLAAAGLGRVQTLQDLEGRDRITLAQREG